eukprot:TRINITY_DN14321_c0_g2_i1.p3 TRINITY_DN14321_c0_g2~~TRINITY_DN14321_c0_g2_i1.p3  ORF type:complete len:200 (+),score=54.48 TRINITY_DN14321_c0_g2_i1:40-600(+)
MAAAYLGWNDGKEVIFPAEHPLRSSARVLQTLFPRAVRLLVLVGWTNGEPVQSSSSLEQLQEAIREERQRFGAAWWLLLLFAPEALSSDLLLSRHRVAHPNLTAWLLFGTCAVGMVRRSIQMWRPKSLLARDTVADVVALLFCSISACFGRIVPHVVTRNVGLPFQMLLTVEGPLWAVLAGRRLLG